MNPEEKLRSLENQVHSLRVELHALTDEVTNLKKQDFLRTELMQRALNNIQNSIDLIFKHGKIPNVNWTPGVRYRLD